MDRGRESTRASTRARLLLARLLPRAVERVSYIGIDDALFDLGPNARGVLVGILRQAPSGAHANALVLGGIEERVSELPGRRDARTVRDVLAFRDRHAPTRGDV